MKTNSFIDVQADTSTIFNGYNQYHDDPNHPEYLVLLLKSFEPTMHTIIEIRHVNIENRTKQIIIGFQNSSSRLKHKTLTLSYKTFV